MTSNKKARIGIIGAGWWGTTAHIPAIKSHPYAELVAIQSLDEMKLKEKAMRFGIPKTFVDYREMIDSTDLDGVVISSTPNVHYEQARYALEHDLHVLVEKPMVIKTAHARELVDLAKEKGKELILGCPWHYTPHAQYAKSIIRGGGIGKVKFVASLFTNFTYPLYKGLSLEEAFARNPEVAREAAASGEYPGRGSYSDPGIAGGGQGYTQVSHSAGFIFFATGLRAKEVFAMMDNADTKVDVFDGMTVRLENGAICTIASHAMLPLTERQHEVRIYGERGMLLMELWQGKLSHHKEDSSILNLDQLPEEERYPYMAPAKNLVDVILGKDENRSPGWIGLYTTELLEAAYQSAATGKRIVLV